MQRIATVLGILVAACRCGFALNPALDVSQYAHTAWTVRDGFSLGNIYAMAQTPDGYLWLGTEFGLFRFDGVRSAPWQPPAGQQLPDKNINTLLATRDGTLWIGTFAGLLTWSGGKLTTRPELGRHFVSGLFEDREGTVWASTLASPGVLCAMRSGAMRCYGEDGAFGRAVWALYEDNSGTLWAAAQTGLWRMRPGPPRRYATPTELIALNKFDDGRLLIAMHAGGLMQLAGDKVASYPVRDPINPNRPLRDRDVDSNRVLRDRDGGLWIGTVERGLIHLHNGRTDLFKKSDGLSGDVVLSIFEDREGNVWTASTGGLDRFREVPVSTISVKQGLSSDATQSVLAAIDGSIWVGAHDGLTRWKSGQATIFRKPSGLQDDAPVSLFQDYRGRIWVSTRRGLAFFNGSRFVGVNSVPGEEVHFIAGDKAGNLWLSESKRLVHLVDERLVEELPWSELGDGADALLADGKQGGVWLAFWNTGGVSYFRDHRIRASYTAADGLGEGHVPDLQLDADGAIWAASEGGGLSRIKDGRIATLSIRNGLPCNAIHWAIKDDDGSLWLYTACGLVRITRNEIEGWIADPKRKLATKVWDAADGVRLRSSAASAYCPRVTKATDGKLWSAARARMQQRLQPGSSFLTADENRDWACRLRRGEVIVARGGSRGLTNVPGGTISDWLGAVFIASVTREQLLAVLDDYDDYEDFYGPVVVASKTLSAHGPEYAFSMILTNKAGFVSTTLDTDYESRVFQVNERRWFSLSKSTHIREIEGYGTTAQHDLAEGTGKGLVWRLFTVARCEQRDGGVYVEIEAMALSRDIPVSLRWAVEPIVRRISQNSLVTSLRQTENAVRARGTLAKLTR
jgi:Predicted periplasmic ligand-binding sensor domain